VSRVDGFLGLHTKMHFTFETNDDFDKYIEVKNLMILPQMRSIQLRMLCLNIRAAVLLLFQFGLYKTSVILILFES